MTRLAGRLVLVTAVVACAVGMFAVPAWARTTPAGGEAGAANVRTLAYNQPLNQSMNGVGAFDGCFAEVDGSITGQPIAAGGFSGIIVATGSCAGPAPCFDVFAFMILGDTSFGAVRCTSSRPGSSASSRRAARVSGSVTPGRTRSWAASTGS